MYSAGGLITLAIAIVLGTIVGNVIQLRYFMDNPTMRTPAVRFGALAVGIAIMVFLVPRLGDDPTVQELLVYGLGWLIIAILVSFVRPPTPLPPRKSPEDRDPPA